MVTTEAIQFPRKLGFLFKPKRYKVLYGGRGGAKSWGIARALITIAAMRKCNILCAREFQNSITESVHRLLQNQIEQMGLGGRFVITNNSIRCSNGSEFIFAGLRNNVTKIKSMEDIDYCWVEEAEKVSAPSWEVLVPTIRKEGSEIWVSFNPDEETDPTSQKFIINPPPDATVVKIGWRDNPWFPSTLRREKDYLFKVDPAAAAHVWDGEFNTRSDAQIFRDKYLVEPFEPHETWAGPYFGQDWGFSCDPAATVKLWIEEREFGRSLYIEHEAFGVGVKNDELGALIRSVPGADVHTIRADCSRPETIVHVADTGLRVIACKKWPGCVEDGIQYLRSFEKIVIHPRCRHMAEEARLYKYKVDKLSGDVLPIIVDKHNHGWDAVRYALEPMIRMTGEDVVSIGEEVQISPDMDEQEYLTNW